MYKIVFLRHGQSVWNRDNRFTGWIDVDLSEQGINEAHDAGKLLKKEGYIFDLAFQNRLKRVKDTLRIVLDELGEKDIEVRTSWQLNERHYGALQGLDKAETRAKYGEEQFKIWRRGYDASLPPISKESSMYPGKDPLYADLKESEIPLSENLKDVVARAIPYWNEYVVPEIKNGRNILLVGSGNSMRAIVKHLENISEKDIVDLNIPTGIPFVYKLDDDMNILSKSYIGDLEEVKKAIEKVANQGKVS